MVTKLEPPPVGLLAFSVPNPPAKHAANASRAALAATHTAAECACRVARRAGRREQNGVSLNGAKITDTTAQLQWDTLNGAILRVGARRYACLKT